MAVSHPEDDGSDDVVQREIAERNLIEPMKQNLCRRPEVNRRVLQPKKEDPWHIQQAADKAASEPVALVGGVVVRKADSEVQEEGWLQCLRHHIAPVKDAQLARRSEAVQYKGSQAKDIEVDRFRRGPPPEQDIDPDAQVDQSDKPQPLIDGPVLRLQNHLDVEPGRAVQIDRLRYRPEDGVGGVCPDAAVPHFAAQG